MVFFKADLNEEADWEWPSLDRYLLISSVEQVLIDVSRWNGTVQFPSLHRFPLTSFVKRVLTDVIRWTGTYALMYFFGLVLDDVLHWTGTYRCLSLASVGRSLLMSFSHFAVQVLQASVRRGTRL